MRRILTPNELDAVMVATPGCCLFRSAKEGRAWHSLAWQAAVHDDLQREKSQYYTDTGADYVRAFRQHGHIFIDCVRDQERIAKSSYRLADLLGETVLVPLLMPGLSQSTDSLPSELLDTFHFRLGPDAPSRLVSFFRFESTKMSFYRIQPKG